MNYSEGDWILQVDGETICVNGARVAKAFDPEHPEKVTDRTRANAHLIKAAPKMYRALKEITELAPRDKLRLPYAIQVVEIADKALAEVEVKHG